MNLMSPQTRFNGLDFMPVSVLLSDIGVASYGALGDVPTRLPTLFFLS